MRYRRYGDSGPLVILVHGGPGAPGCLAPLARDLALRFHVLEPFQRASGDKPLKVALHVRDLHQFVHSHSRDSSAIVVGHSWGAMLTLAFAAEHPQAAAALVLVGCGTFDPESRRRLGDILDQRIDSDLRRRLSDLEHDEPDLNERLKQQAGLLLRPYSHHPIESLWEVGACDFRAFDESWADMLRLQEAGVYPATFSAIQTPVLMLHGAADPHPGPMIRDSLLPHLPQLEYRGYEKCGHYPWLERAARAGFLHDLVEWMSDRSRQ